MKAVLLVSHGSKSRKIKEEVRQLVQTIKSQSTIPIIEFAFLEIESPRIPQGVEKCVAKGASQITILLNFLNSGKHIDEDIPRIVDEAQRKYPAVKFNITKPVGSHSLISKIFLDHLK